MVKRALPSGMCAWQYVASGSALLFHCTEKRNIIHSSCMKQSSHRPDWRVEVTKFGLWQVKVRVLLPPSLSYARNTSIRPPDSGPQVGAVLSICPHDCLL